MIRSDDSFAERTAKKLKSALDNRAPSIWVSELTGESAKSLGFVKSLTSKVTLEHIIHNSRSEGNEFLPCVCLSTGTRRTADIFT